MPAPTAEKFTRYQLRRTLAPWKFRETIDEVLEFSKAHGIEEVIWKIDTEEISHGLPTLERIRGYLPALNESRERFGAAGIAMSINPWVTLGMRDAGWDLRKTFPDFEWLTDITGVQAKSQGCPLSPAWRQWLCDAYDLYASTGPKILWLEDDFRVHRHRPVTVACYCDRHVREFSQKIGRTFTRELLAAEVLKPGVPSPIRSQWFDFIGGVMCEAVEMLGARIYKKYPSVQLGLMGNSPEVSASERRDWDRLMRAVAGPHPRVTFRPSMGNYQETNLRGMYAARANVAGTLALIRRPVHTCTEIENGSYSRYSKSYRITRTQILLSAALRCPSMTLNLFDHCGTPIAVEAGHGKLLSDMRPMLDQIVAAFPPEGIERGVQMLAPENGSDNVQLQPGQKFPALQLPPEFWAEILQATGNSLTWQPSPVTAISGQRIRAYRNKIDELFAGGILLDAAALEALHDMVGPTRLRQLTGITLNALFDRRDRVTSIEAMIDPEFGGPVNKNDPANVGSPVPAKHTTVDQAGLTTRVADMSVDPAVRVISRLINADLEPLLPGFTLFENSLGGRVALCPFTLGTSSEPDTWFLSAARERQLAQIIHWLFRGKTPLHVEGGVYGLPLRTDYPDHISLALFNLSLDPWQHATLRLSTDHPPKSVHRLKNDGQWEKIDSHHWNAPAGQLTINAPAPLDIGDVTVFRIE